MILRAAPISSICITLAASLLLSPLLLSSYHVKHQTDKRIGGRIGHCVICVCAILIAFGIATELYFVQHQIGGPFHLTYISMSKIIHSTLRICNSKRASHTHYDHAYCEYNCAVHIYA